MKSRVASTRKCKGQGPFTMHLGRLAQSSWELPRDATPHRAMHWPSKTMVLTSAAAPTKLMTSWHLSSWCQKQLCSQESLGDVPCHIITILRSIWTSVYPTPFQLFLTTQACSETYLKENVFRLVLKFKVCTLPVFLQKYINAMGLWALQS